MRTVLRNSPPAQSEAPTDEFTGLEQELVKARRELNPGFGRERASANPALAAVEAALADIAAERARWPRRH
jgi:L-alanine-DL-glutamate epimerase-like enolase superfamily enzyme